MAVRKIGLSTNKGKTKYLLISNARTESADFKVKCEEETEYVFEEVKCFNYLGVVFTNNDSEEVEIKTRLTKGNKCMRMLDKFLFFIVNEFCFKRIGLCLFILLGICFDHLNSCSFLVMLF